MSPSIAPQLQTGHIGLNVSDLKRAVRFYQDVFGFEVMQASDAPDRQFAFLGTGGALVLTLWQQSQGEFPPASPGLHHLSFMAASMDEVLAAEQRAKAAGARFFHDGVVAHAEGAASGGIFFADPDGIRLEIFAPAGAEGKDAPSTSAPTCGFFRLEFWDGSL